MAQEISDKEISELFDKARSGMLFKVWWHYHVIVKSKFSQFIWTKLNKSKVPVNAVKPLIKAYPHIVWLIRMDGAPDGEERVSQINASFSEYFKRKD
jgi:hypothetical protein